MNMENALASGMAEATRLTTAGWLADAVAAIKRLLGGKPPSTDTNMPARGPVTIDAQAEGAAQTGQDAQARWNPNTGADGLPRGRATGSLSGRARETAAAASGLRGVFDPVRYAGFHLPNRGASRSAPDRTTGTLTEGARFLEATFENKAGKRPYKLYVPSGYRPGVPAPLIVMLHGCTQSPDDFAAGTRMNDAAEANTCLVVYPGQTTAANMQKCWNWFSEKDQRRDAGEPSLIAGITREVMRDYAIDPARVYVSGLSAGGAAAAIMGDAYPDLYAAIGVHSGLACGAAHDMPSAFTAMKQGGGGSGHRGGGHRGGMRGRVVPAIIFHGDRDTTVSPRNGDAVVAQSTGDATLRLRAEEGRAPGGHAYRRTLHADANGRAVVEQWVVHGAGHAWFGGSPNGSYTDARGPDATGEMLRFFLEHPHEDHVPRTGR